MRTNEAMKGGEGCGPRLDDERRGERGMLFCPALALSAGGSRAERWPLNWPRAPSLVTATPLPATSAGSL